jgi:DMSO reductase family type II enzyme chaperone
MAAPHEELLFRSAVYELLSLAFLHPEQGTAALLTENAGQIAQAASKLGWRNIEAALEQLSHHLSSLDDAMLVDQHTAIFGHTISSDCSPYEGEYGQAHVFQKSHTLADLNTFYRAFGVTPNPALKDRPDHVSVEMEFMHLLTLKEAYAQLHNHGEDKVLLCRQAQEAFFSNHLANWVREFAHQVTRKTGRDSVYGSLARLLDVHINRESEALRSPSEPPSPVSGPILAEDDQERYACPISCDAAAQEVVVP